MTSERCHSCGSEGLEIFYELDGIPVHSCLMVSNREDALTFPTGDLRLGFCTSCGFIQNCAFDPSVHNYSPEYEETQSFSPHFRRFQTELCKRQIEKHELAGKTVLEIGSGKGEFLVELCELSGSRGVGFDPGYRPERTTSAAASRIEFIRDFYSEKYSHLAADYVCCRHTLEHIQPVHNFVEMIRRTLDLQPKTAVFFEVPDVERILVEQALWDLYYEHCTYFTLGSLARLFRACGFEVLDLYKGFDDQYLMIEARPGGSESGHRFIGEDDPDQTARQVKQFHERLPAKLRTLRDQLEGRSRVVVWGSGSKAVSYLTTLGIREAVTWIVDVNPYKHGKFLAGTGHEIVAPEFLATYRPDLVVIMNPVYVDEVRADLEQMDLAPELVAV